jgi:hypothetical protein
MHIFIPIWDEHSSSQTYTLAFGAVAEGRDWQQVWEGEAELAHVAPTLSL